MTENRLISTKNAVISGIIAAIAHAFPTAAMIALVYQFPVPFVGQVSGIEAMVPAMFAVAFYGVFLMGFVGLGLTGAIIGLVVARLQRDVSRRNARMRIWGAAFVLNLFVGSILSNANF